MRLHSQPLYSGTQYPGVVIPTDELEDFPRRSRLRIALWIGLAVAMIVALALSLRPAEERGMPDFELELLTDSGTLSLEDLKGKPTVLNFWASWCTPCREEAATLEDASRKYSGEVQFVGVDIQDTEDNARAFLEEFDVTYPIVLDYDRTLASELGVPPLPQTFFIDADGNLLGSEAGEELGQAQGTTFLGAISAAELEEQIEALLEGGP